MARQHIRCVRVAHHNGRSVVTATTAVVAAIVLAADLGAGLAIVAAAVRGAAVVVVVAVDVLRLSSQAICMIRVIEILKVNRSCASTFESTREHSLRVREKSGARAYFPSLGTCFRY